MGFVSLDIAVVVPNRTHVKIFRDQYIPVGIIYTEADFGHRARGQRFDHIFVDDADLFQDNPLWLCQIYAPGVPATFTYTPFNGSSLPKPLPQPEPSRVRYSEIDYI